MPSNCPPIQAELKDTSHGYEVSDNTPHMPQTGRVSGPPSQPTPSLGLESIPQKSSSFSCRRRRMCPFSPQSSPHELRMRQYFSPDLSSTPYPVRSTAWFTMASFEQPAKTPPA